MYEPKLDPSSAFGGTHVTRQNVQIGSTKRFARAAVPLLAALLGCSGTIGSTPNDEMNGSGSTTGNGAGSGSGGNGSKASGGSSSAGKGSVTAGSAGALGTAGSGEEPQSGEPRPVSMEGEPIYSRFVRLTNVQWENSVQDLLHLSAPTGLSDAFLDPVSGVTDFDNNERVVIVDNTVWADFQTAAETLADQVTATDAALQQVQSGTDPDAFIRTFGRRAFRRDLTAAEVTSFQALYEEGSTSEGTQSAYTKGINWVIAAMLQSPHFLYRVEMGDDGAPLSGEEMATKLSLWLRDRTPSDAMLDAAGSYATAEGAATQVEALLDDPATAAVISKFHGQLYKLELYENIRKDNVSGYSEALNAELKEASYKFFERIFNENLGVRDILTSKVGFAGRGLATIYGVSVQGSGVQQVNLPDRTGYYTQSPFLTLYALNNDPDSIHRGVRINLDTLCADPGLPNAILPAIPALEEGQTNRARIVDLTEGCGMVCHGEIINPIGFAFEDFDGLGRYREEDNGSPVDTTGKYPFAEGVKEFANSTELMELIANGEQAHQCYAKKMAGYAVQRDLVEGERPLVVELGQVSQASGASLKQIMLALVKSNSFRTHVGGAQ